MIYRCVWEDLDMQLLPLTKEAERQALQEFRNHYLKQDCPLSVYTHRHMQLWHKVLIHKGDQWMTEEELRQHYLKRVDPRTRTDGKLLSESTSAGQTSNPAVGPGFPG